MQFDLHREKYFEMEKRIAWLNRYIINSNPKPKGKPLRGVIPETCWLSGGTPRMLWVGGTLQHLKGHFPPARVPRGADTTLGCGSGTLFPPTLTFLYWNNIPDKADATTLTREQNLLCELTRTPLRKQDKHKIYFLGLFLPGVLNCCSSANNLPLQCLSNLLIIECITQQRGKLGRESDQ